MACFSPLGDTPSTTTKVITSFKFINPAASGNIIEDTHTISVTVPYGTSVKALVPTVTYNGSSISPLSGVAQNFSSPVIYTVTKTNGSTQAYTVTVYIAQNTTPTSSQYFWGDWTRMDTGEAYLISDESVRIGTAAAQSVTSSSATSLSFGTSTIQKVSDNVASLGANALLFRNGGTNRAFTARLAGFTDGAARTLEARGIGIGNQPIGGRPGTRTNTGNASDTQTVTSASDGTLQFTGAVANSPQNIEIDTTGTSAQPVNVTVQPSFDGEFVGTIPIVESGYSFKVVSGISDSQNGYQYGNGYDTYVLSININNIGNADCSTSLYEVESQDPKLQFLSGTINISGQGSVPAATTTGNFSSIEPGASKPLYFIVQYGQLDTEYIDATIKINITDSGTVPRTWEDYAVLRFYRRPVTLNITSSNLDGTSSAQLKGFLMHPDGKSQRFTVSNNGKASVTMPWSSKPYNLVFSGAGAETEMKYSFALGASPADLSGTWSIADINSYEANDSELTKTIISNPQTPIKSYLKKGDIDYYQIDVSGTPGEFKPIAFNAYSLSDSATGNNGDNLPNPGETLTMDMRIQNISGSTKYVNATLASTSEYITFTKASYAYGDIGAGYYRNCYSYSERSTADYTLIPSSSYFAFTIASNTPIGTVIPVSASFDTQGNTWTDNFSITVVKTGASLVYNAKAFIDSGNGDNLPNAGESTSMDMRIRNSGTSDVIGLTATLSSISTYIAFTKASYVYGDIGAGYYRNCYSYSERSTADYTMSPSSSYFAFTIAPNTPVGSLIPVTITFADTQGNSWTDSFSVAVVKTGATLVYNAKAFIDSGNGDNLPNAGESMSMDMRIQNSGTSDVIGLTATLSSISTYITFTKDSYAYGDIGAGYYRNCYSYSERSTADYSLSPSASYYAFTIATNTPVNSIIPVTITFADTQGNTWTDSFSITVVKTGANILINAKAFTSTGSPYGMDMRIQNSGTSDVIGLTASLSSTSSYISFTKASYSFGDISAGYYRNCYSYSERSTADYTLSPSTSYFSFSIIGSPASGTIIPVSVAFSDTQGNTWTGSFSIAIQ